MVVHFVIDGKLIDQIIENFMKVSDQHLFLVFGTAKGKEEFSRITYKGNNIEVFDGSIESLNKIIDLYQVKTIFLHSLSPEYASLVNKINKPVVFCWIIWGYDVYSLPRISYGLYGAKTMRYLIWSDPLFHLKAIINKSQRIREFLFSLLKRKDNASVLLRAISKIQYAATYIKEDYEILSKHYKNNIKFVVSAFSTTNQYLANHSSPTLHDNASNIMLGNSNSLSSNYPDAIHLLGKHLDKLKKVFVVLSYGEDDKHKARILKLGTRILHDHFSPLTEFLPRKEYVEILRSCSVGIFNHYRQRAMGNIIAMLYMGSRVYLSSRNPAYHFFLRKGIKVFSIEKDFSIYGVSKPENHIVAENKRLLDSIFEEDKVISDLKKLADIVTTD